MLDVLSSADLVKTGKIDLSDVRFFVLDEADRLVSESADAAAILDLYKKLPKAVHHLQVAFNFIPCFPYVLHKT